MYPYDCIDDVPESVCDYVDSWFNCSDAPSAPSASSAPSAPSASSAPSAPSASSAPSVRYRVTLTYEDGSREVIAVVAADAAVVMMVARGWLLGTSLGSSVRYYPIDEDGKMLGIGGKYVR